MTGIPLDQVNVTLQRLLRKRIVTMTTRIGVRDAALRTGVSAAEVRFGVIEGLDRDQRHASVAEIQSQGIRRICSRGLGQGGGAESGRLRQRPIRGISCLAA